MILTSSGKPLDGLSLLQAEAKSKAEAKPKAEPKEPGQEARVERKGPKSTVWKQGDAGPDIRSIDIFFSVNTVRTSRLGNIKSLHE